MLRRALCLAGLLALAAPAHSAPVDPGLRAAAREGPVRFLVLLEDRADLSALPAGLDKAAKGREVFAALTAAAARSQEGVCAALEARGVEYRAYWIVNAVAATGDADVLDAVAAAPGVSRVVRDVEGRRDEPLFPGKPRTAPAQPASWGVAHIGAPGVWAMGYTGEGVVVGGVDTGYQWDHPELKRQYRGWDGETVSHDYHWFDGVPESRVGCPGNSPEPCDDDGHGTHTMGTMVGGDGDFSTIGVAPGATWIGCRAWEPDLRTHLSYLLTCLQFMLAPTDLAGENPRPELAPHVMNHSWFCEAVEGCTELDALQEAFSNLRAAGILQLGGAGNDGASCGSIVYPPPIYPDYFTVGATANGFDTIALFSSRGPVTNYGEPFLKPDITAPGVNILSAHTGDRYVSWSGTSMAGPHVAGTVALLLHADPSLAGDVDAIESILEETAVRRTRDNQVCGGGFGGAGIPNVVYGWGRLDALAAVRAVLGVPVLPDNGPVPGRLALGPNVPNPVAGATRIPYSVGAAGPVRLTVYDVRGRRVRTLLDEARHGAGEFFAGWDATDDAGRRVAAGIYLARLTDGTHSTARRMVVR